MAHLWTKLQRSKLFCLACNIPWYYTHFTTYCFISQAFLANENLGDSLDSVEALFKKHDDFEKSLATQEEKK